MKRLWTKRVLAGLCLLVLAMFLIRPSAGRLKWRVSQSISQALGRNVEISSLHVRFLPRPGFEFDNLVVHDDPAFGAEPLLRSPDVSAYLSLGALLRGRLQVSTLSLSEASLNLTRDAQGRWNLHDLVERTSRSALSPTGRTHRGGAPFPYIEGTRGRINLKFGTEKTHFALTNAEFALWQDSDNTWALRVKAAPIRTDTNLTDTGIVEVNGRWQRAAMLQQSPVQFSFQWQHAQIGQVSKLVYGVDQGWRGDAILSGSVSGTPEKLQINAETSIDDFRRQDVIGGGDLQLKAQCALQYSVTALVLSNLNCIAPSADGVLQIKGDAAEHGNAGPSYEFQISAAKIPASQIIFSLQHLNPRLTAQPIKNGQVDGSFQITRTQSGAANWDGQGSIRDLELDTNGSVAPISIPNVPFSVSSGGPQKAEKQRRPTRHSTIVALNSGQSSSAHDPVIHVGPFNLTGPKPDSLQAEATLSLAEYHALVKGSSAVKRLLHLAHLFGIPAPAVSAEGNATVDLTISGDWASKGWPLVTGHAQLHGVRAQVRGLNSPVEVVSANVVVHEERVDVQNLTATAAATWHGNLSIARPCLATGNCSVVFNLRTAELSAAALNKLLNPGMAKGSWYRIFSVGNGPKPYLMQAHATGKVAIDTLILGRTNCEHFTSDVRLDSGVASLAGYKADVIGGSIIGNLRADFNGKNTNYGGDGSFNTISLSAVSELMNNDWARGVGSAKFEFTAQGSSFPELFDTALGKADFEVTDAEFPHVALSPTSGSLHASKFVGGFLLHRREFSLNDAQLESPAGVYKISGTASLDGSLSLKLTSESSGAYNVTGSLMKTRVAVIPTAQASLKP